MPRERNLSTGPNQRGLCKMTLITVHTHLCDMMILVKVEKRNGEGAGEDAKNKTVKKTQHMYVGWSTCQKEKIKT